jgi:hypothetical protein
MSRTTNIQSRAGEVGTRRESIDKLRTLPGLVLTYDRDFINDLARSIEYSIKRFGRLLRPIVVSRDLYVLDGYAVITAAGRLGLREVDVYEVPITCAEDVTVCIGLYYTLNELRRKDTSPIARRRALYELVLRYLANLVDDEYAELVQEMYNDVVPNKLIKYVQSLVPLPYATIYRDLELFIVHPKLFEGIVQVRSADIKRILASLPDSLFSLPHALIEELKHIPKGKRTEALNARLAASGLVSNTGTRTTGITEAPRATTGASGATITQASGASSIIDIININNINTAAAREAPPLGASVVAAPSPGAPGIGVSSRGSLDIASAVKYAKDQLEDVKDDLKRLVEGYLPGLDESVVDELVRDLMDRYVIYPLHVRFSISRGKVSPAWDTLQALRWLIYRHLLNAFEDVMDTIATDIARTRNVSIEDMLAKLYGALKSADRRVGIGGARGPKGMVPFFAALMCELLKALDEVGGGYYEDGVGQVCRAVEESILRRFDNLRRGMR